MDRRYSLRKNKEFRYVYNTGKSVATKNMVLIYRRRKMPDLKVGFSVSKKVGKAVTRNRVRRRLKEAFPALLPEIDRRVLLVVVARPPVVDADFAKICADLRYLLKRADLIANEHKTNSKAGTALDGKIL